MVRQPMAITNNTRGTAIRARPCRSESAEFGTCSSVIGNPNIRPNGARIRRVVGILSDARQIEKSLRFARFHRDGLNRQNANPAGCAADRMPLR